MKKFIKPIFALTLLLFISCSSDAESDLFEPEETGEEVVEETPITYNDDIRPIINNNCLACHSDPPTNGAPFGLVNYDQVRLRAENGQLLNAMSRQAGDPRIMPPSGRLSQATLDLIEAWIQDGLLEE